jgi:hypothetical protein
MCSPLDNVKKGRDIMEIDIWGRFRRGKKDDQVEMIQKEKESLFNDARGVFTHSRKDSA